MWRATRASLIRAEDAVAVRSPPGGRAAAGGRGGAPSRFIKSGAADAANASRSLREFKLEAARTSCARHGVLYIFTDKYMILYDTRL